jgi:hypothetical protein
MTPLFVHPLGPLRDTHIAGLPFFYPFGGTNYGPPIGGHPTLAFAVTPRGSDPLLTPHLKLTSENHLGGPTWGFPPLGTPSVNPALGTPSVYPTRGTSLWLPHSFDSTRCTALCVPTLGTPLEKPLLDDSPRRICLGEPPRGPPGPLCWNPLVRTLSGVPPCWNYLGGNSLADYPCEPPCGTTLVGTL